MSRRFKDIFFILGGVILGTVVSLTATLVLAHGGDTSKVHSCVKNSTLLPGAANVRIVGATTNCNSNETAVDWDKNAASSSASTDNKPPFVCTFHCWFNDFPEIFKGKDFSYAVINQLQLENADMSNTNFNHAHLNGSFTGSNLSSSNFTSGALINIVLSNTNLTSANFTNATIIGSFNNANLQNTNFTNANFTSSDFTGATNMNTATITGATWNNTICPDGTNSDSNGNTCAGHLTP